MNFIQTAALTEFRGLHNLELQDCAQVNLLVGMNNSGKTTVLEALALLCRPDDVPWWIETIWPREIKSARTAEGEVVKLLFPHYSAGMDEELFAGMLKLGALVQSLPDAFFPEHAHAWRWINAQLKEENIATRDLDFFRTPRADGSYPSPPAEAADTPTITSTAANLGISVAIGENKLRSVWHQFSKEGALPYATGSEDLHIPCSYVTTVAHRTESLADRVGAVFLKNRRAALTALLQSFQPTIETFEAIPKAGQRPQIWLQDKKTGWLPLSVAGDGLRRAFHFAVAAANCEGGVLLVDEIESALHTTALRNVFGFLVRECKALGVQIFATTHSLEAIDAIVQECSDIPDTLAAFILTNNGATRRLNADQLHTIRAEYGYDIR